MSKCKFKVGDKVKVVRANKEHKSEFVGEIYTIRNVNPNGNLSFGTHYGVIEPCGYVWFENELKLVVDEKS